MLAGSAGAFLPAKSVFRDTGRRQSVGPVGVFKLHAGARRSRAMTQNVAALMQCCRSVDNGLREGPPWS